MDHLTGLAAYSPEDDRSTKMINQGDMKCIKMFQEKKKSNFWSTVKVMKILPQTGANLVTKSDQAFTHDKLLLEKF